MKILSLLKPYATHNIGREDHSVASDSEDDGSPYKARRGDGGQRYKQQEDERREARSGAMSWGSRHALGG